MLLYTRLDGGQTDKNWGVNFEFSDFAPWTFGMISIAI
jgi:hypothetical protein